MDSNDRFTGFKAAASSAGLLTHNGAVGRNRTRDIQFTKLALYRLSYDGNIGGCGRI
jgi:hypothetical protein